MKNILSSVTLICATLHGAVSYADTFADYIIAGSNCSSDCDGPADSFSITFKYDETLQVISNVSEGSFTDIFGTYTGIRHIVWQTNPDTVVINALGYGIQLNNLADSIYKLELASSIPLYPNYITALAQTITIDPYVGNDWIGYNYVNISAVPEPSEWVIMLLGLPLLSWVAHRKLLSKKV